MTYRCISEVMVNREMLERCYIIAWLVQLSISLFATKIVNKFLCLFGCSIHGCYFFSQGCLKTALLFALILLRCEQLWVSLLNYFKKQLDNPHLNQMLRKSCYNCDTLTLHIKQYNQRVTTTFSSWSLCFFKKMQDHLAKLTQVFGGIGF